jgi:hypothetical protein
MSEDINNGYRCINPSIERLPQNAASCVCSHMATTLRRFGLLGQDRSSSAGKVVLGQNPIGLLRPATAPRKKRVFADGAVNASKRTLRARS